jgi:hypothetical protein
VASDIEAHELLDGDNVLSKGTLAYFKKQTI